jgi:hypothetical protein
MLEGYRLNAFQGLCVGILIQSFKDARSDAYRKKILTFFRSEHCGTICDACGIEQSLLITYVSRKKKGPTGVEVHKNGKMVYHAKSMNDASRFSGDNDQSIAKLVETGGTSVRGYKYKKDKAAKESENAAGIESVSIHGLRYHSARGTKAEL